MKSGDFYGYTIYENGDVVNKHGKYMSIRENSGRYEVKLTINNKRKAWSLSRIIYYIFVQEFDLNNPDLCISSIDGDRLNIDYRNLRLVHRKDLIQGENHALAKISNEDTEYIRSVYTGPSVNQHDKTGYSYKELADMFGVKKQNIKFIIKGESRNKEKYKLKDDEIYID